MSEKELSSLEYTILGIMIIKPNNCLPNHEIMKTLMAIGAVPPSRGAQDVLDDALYELLKAGHIRELEWLDCYRLVRDEK